MHIVRYTRKFRGIRRFTTKRAPALIAAAAFPQYAIESAHVHDALVVAHEIVRTNGVAVHAPYMLLTEEFFTSVFEEVLDVTERALEERLG